MWPLGCGAPTRSRVADAAANAPFEIWLACKGFAYYRKSIRHTTMVHRSASGSLAARRFLLIDARNVLPSVNEAPRRRRSIPLGPGPFRAGPGLIFGRDVVGDSHSLPASKQGLGRRGRRPYRFAFPPPASCKFAASACSLAVDVNSCSRLALCSLIDYISDSCHVYDRRASLTPAGSLELAAFDTVWRK
jgi:hypothetical protein